MNVAKIIDAGVGVLGHTMERSWKHVDAFPVVARIIEVAYAESNRFITAREIAARLLQDTEGRNLVEAARKLQEEKQSLKLVATNMVAWFSQQISVGKSDWVRTVERTRIDGVWAYKPIATAGP